MTLSNPLLAAAATALLIAACVPQMPETKPAAALVETPIIDETATDTTVGEATDPALPDLAPAAAVEPAGPFGPVELFPAIGPSVLQPFFF